MKIIVQTLLFLALLLLPVDAEGEENVEKVVDSLDLTALEQLAEDAAPDLDLRGLILDLASGEAGLDLEGAYAQAQEIFLQEWRQMLSMLPGLLVPALISAVTRRLAGRERSSDTARYLCYLACAVAQIALLGTLINEAEALISRVTSLSDAVFPLLSGLLALSGATAAASLLTPMAALLGKLIVSLLGGLGLRLCSAAAAIAVAGNLSPKITLKNLFSLITSVVNWTLGLVMTGFVGLMSVQGLLGAGYDSTSVRAARYAVDNLLPVIGGEVADTMDALISSVLLVKNAAGVTGMLLLVILCAQPLLRIAAALVSLRLSAAVIEPLAEDALTRLTGQFARVAQMLLAISAACVVLSVLLLGAMLTAGRGVVR